MEGIPFFDGSTTFYVLPAIVELPSYSFSVRAMHIAYRPSPTANRICLREKTAFEWNREQTHRRTTRKIKQPSEKFFIHRNAKISISFQTNCTNWEHERVNCEHTIYSELNCGCGGKHGKTNGNNDQQNWQKPGMTEREEKKAKKLNEISMSFFGRAEKNTLKRIPEKRNQCFKGRYFIFVRCS